MNRPHGGITHNLLIAHLDSLGWRPLGYGFKETYCESTNKHRSGKVPHADEPRRIWDTATWARVKKDLQLEGEELNVIQPR